MNDILQHNFTTIKPVSIFTTKIINPDMNDKLTEQIRKSGDKQDYKTNVKAYMTDWVMTGLPGFDTFEKHVLDITKFLSKKYYNREINPRLSDLWGMIYKKGDYAITHDHWPALWSGVYYIKAPENSGALLFPQLKQKIIPTDNMLIIFDGATRHGVGENLSDEERVAVSLNVKETI